MIKKTFARMPSLVTDIVRSRFGDIVKPRLLTYTITFRCNARCIMCDSWRKSGEGDLTLDEVEKIFQQINTLDAVRLTGGEPFVRKDLPDIVRLVEKYLQPYMVHITTNGFLTDRIVEFCEHRNKKKLLQLMVSLDGLEKKHNHVRGSNIAFKTAMETLKSLAPRKSELKLDLVVNQTIVDREGIEQYRLLREELLPLGIRHQAVMAYDASSTYSLETELDLAPQEIGQFTTFGEFEKKDFQELFMEMEKDVEQFSLMTRTAKRYYIRGMRQRLLGEHKQDKLLNPPCVALKSHLRIFPNGDVPTCQFNSKTIGNLRHQTFEEVWESELAKSQRSWVSRCKGCWAECEVIPNALYSLDIVKAIRTS